MREGACIGAATMPQPSTLRLILNGAEVTESSTNKQHHLTRCRERPESTGVSKVFPGKRRLKLSQGETLYFRWTQFGI